MNTELLSAVIKEAVQYSIYEGSLHEDMDLEEGQARVRMNRLRRHLDTLKQMEKDSAPNPVCGVCGERGHPASAHQAKALSKETNRKPTNEALQDINFHPGGQKAVRDLKPTENPFHQRLTNNGWKYKGTAYKKYKPTENSRDVHYADHSYHHPTHGIGTVSQDENSAQFFEEPNPKNERAVRKSIERNQKKHSASSVTKEGFELQPKTYADRNARDTRLDEDAVASEKSIKRNQKNQKGTLWQQFKKKLQMEDGEDVLSPDELEKATLTKPIGTKKVLDEIQKFKVPNSNSFVVPTDQGNAARMKARAAVGQPPAKQIIKSKKDKPLKYKTDFRKDSGV